MKKISFYIFTVLILLPIFVSCFLFVQSVSAASVIDLNNQYPVFGNFDISKVENQQLNSLIAWFYYATIGISGFAALIMIIFGGFQYLTSAGNPGAIGEAKDKIKNALLGLLIIFASYLILNTVNPDFLNLTITNLSPNKEDGSGDGGGIIPEGAFTVNDQEKIFTIEPGEEITLKWDIKKVDRCEANSYCEQCTGQGETTENPNWIGKLSSVQGSKSFNLEKTTKFYLVCYGNFTYVEDVTVTVSSCTGDCPTPQVDLKIKTKDGQSDGPVNSAYSEIPNYILEFSWTSTGADKCSGSGPGSFTFPSAIGGSGTFSSLVTSEYKGWQTFTMTCQNDNGSTLDTVKINFDYP